MKTLIKIGTLIMGLGFVVAGMRYAAAQIPVQNNDSDVLGVVAAIDRNEIAIAQLAEQKNINHKVLDYARMLQDQHSKNLDELRHLSKDLGIPVADNHTVQDIRAKGRQDLEALTPLDGDPFAQLYVADMIKGHSGALNWIESQDIQNGKLKKFIDDTKDHIAMHLKKAQDLQGYEQ